MAADDSKDEILLAVPSDVSNLKDAIEEGRARCEESGKMASAGQKYVMSTEARRFIGV
jgi:hypothetical protein